MIENKRDPLYRDEWIPRRLNIDPEEGKMRSKPKGLQHMGRFLDPMVIMFDENAFQEIKLIHFSGELKYWHMLSIGGSSGFLTGSH